VPVLTLDQFGLSDPDDVTRVVIVMAQMKSAQTFAGHSDRENVLPLGEA
jgi:hypothetical protein